ncbi:1930_t:CDS:1, partial [Dentiscutata heterogama]
TLHAKSTTSCPRSSKYISIDLNTDSLILGSGPGSNITTFGGFTRHPDPTIVRISALISSTSKSLLCLFINCFTIISNFSSHSDINAD